MFRAAERLDALDGQQVRGDARDLRSHAVEHAAQLLDVGFARGVVDRRETLGQHGRHDDVGRTRHRGLVEQHVRSPQLAPLDHEEFVGDVEVELRPEFLEAEEVGVEASPADLVSARFGDVSHAETGQHRADEHDRTPQAGAAAAVVVRAEVVEVDLPGAERIGVVREPFDLHAHCAQQLDELHDVEYLGNVAHGDPFGGQQRGAKDLERLVLGALGGDGPVEAVASFDFEHCHMFRVFRLRGNAACLTKLARFHAFPGDFEIFS